MTMWVIPDNDQDSTELVVIAETRDKAIAKAKAYVAEKYPRNRDRHSYDQTEAIEGDVYIVPMYGYSW